MQTSLNDEISAANRRFMDCFRTGDRQGFAEMYTPDAVLMVPGIQTLEGHAGAAMLFDAMRSQGVTAVELTTLELAAHGETAWERGSFKTQGADGTNAGTGRYIVIWKRTAQGWRLHRDIFNADAAA
jgi:ketosteroid isomerase-like protein